LNKQYSSGVRSILYASVITLALLLPRYVQAQDWIRQVIDLTINTRFAQAESLLTNRLQSGMTGVEEYFYYASLLNSRMTHFENNRDEGKFFEVLAKTIALADQKLHDSSALPEARKALLYFYRGSAYGYRAYYYGQTGNWLSAVDDGLKAAGDLKTCLAIDSACYDAYLGVGVIKYWQSTKLKYVLWLPFIEDTRLEGIAEIKKAVGRGQYSRFSAMHQLIYILLDNGQYDEALCYADTAITAYPASQFMRWAHAHALFKAQRYPEAIPSYLKLLELIEKDPQANPSHWLVCQVRLAENFDRLGKGTECLERCRLALSRNYPQADQSRISDRIAKARELQEKNKVPAHTEQKHPPVKASIDR
jgi:tetratricopeptide (TPR) repeat protein